MIRKFTYKNEVEFRAAEAYFKRHGYDWANGAPLDYPEWYTTIGVDRDSIWYNVVDNDIATAAASLLPNEMLKALKNAM